MMPLQSFFSRVLKNEEVRLYALLLLAAVSLPAQTATLTGRVSDPSDAIVPGAAVIATGPGGAHKAQSGADGAYSITNLNPGTYKVTASAPQLATPQPVSIALRPGVNTLNLQVKVTTANQQLTVSDNSLPAVSRRNCQQRQRHHHQRRRPRRPFGRP